MKPYVEPKRKKIEAAHLAEQFHGDISHKVAKVRAKETKQFHRHARRKDHETEQVLVNILRSDKL
jgi:hypothetical protein